MKFVFLGGQGSGKSTQAKLLADYLNLPLVEMGQIFREKSQDNDEEGQAIRDRLAAGELVPDNIAVSTLQKKISNADFKEGYILDGYPRNAAQLEGLEPDIDKVFFVKVSDEEAIKRLSLRARADDSKEALRRRLQIYHEQTEPLLEKFNEEGKLITIEGERTIEEIHNDIRERVTNYEKQLDQK